MQNNPSLVLASSSITRRALLDRIGMPYQIDAPDIDERVHENEAAEAACRRLARGKARTVAERHPGSVVIGSDQLVSCDERIMGKPHDRPRAIEQLRFMSGKAIYFHVSVAVIDAHGGLQEHSETVTAHLRSLSDSEIQHYLTREQPFNSAGSMKSEGLGTALLESMQSNDPTAILGLPLIATLRLLRAAGINPLG
ncbi:Maf family protein [Halothiobacillus sp.]|uniref:Maf family protein n=1 Tax=Halothiobacillus sp. TaxID=1891311 RepID=UPI0026124322|nr:Maf family protein [Halothiobacillus sp.]